MSFEPPKTKRELLRQTLKILRRYGIKPRKRLSQNFMVDPKIAHYIISRLELEGKSRVLEVGAGIGNLTVYLALKAESVVAVEVDEKLAKILQDRTRDFGNVEVVVGDYLKIEPPKTDYLVSNTPYHISSKVLFKALREGYSKLIMSFQKEFAQRLVAKPNTRDYGRLTVAVNLLSRVEVIKSFKPRSFYPPPKVETVLVEVKPKPKLESVELNLLDEVLKAMFSQKNKLAYKPLSTLLKRYEVYEEFRVECNRLYEKLVEKKVRELTPQDFLEVAECIESVKRS